MGGQEVQAWYCWVAIFLPTSLPEVCCCMCLEQARQATKHCMQVHKALVHPAGWAHLRGWVCKHSTAQRAPALVVTEVGCRGHEGGWVAARVQAHLLRWQGRGRHHVRRSRLTSQASGHEGIRPRIFTCQVRTATHCSSHRTERERERETHTHNQG